MSELRMHCLPETGYLRLSQIIGNSKANPPIPALIPVSKSTWWAGVKSGRYPQPVRTLGERITAWRVEDIRNLIQYAARAGYSST
ncbi:MAG: AlpA family transcriptional regulator [Rugosibacter sp.]|nr:AlpA family transcriptional regulator [Rugosibacter sp.]